MKKKPWMIRIEVDEQDFGTICVCALRYAMGRETYMPGLVRDFVRPLLPQICDKSLEVMLQDCDFQERNQIYGDDRIDKPGWVRWRQELQEEKDRRNSEAKE